MATSADDAEDGTDGGERRPVTRAASHPLGPTLRADGVSFAVYAARATSMELLLFDGPDGAAPARVVSLDHARIGLAITTLSVGVPMLLMGDEARRTQGGNNNAYCHDDETTWFDWSLVELEAALVADVRALISLRRRLQALLLVDHGLPLREALRSARVAWSGVRLGEPDLSEGSRSLALTVHGPGGIVHYLCSAYWEPLTFEVPPGGEDAPFRVALDTGRPAGSIVAPGTEAPIAAGSITVGPRSVMVLVSDHGEHRS